MSYDETRATYGAESRYGSPESRIDRMRGGAGEVAGRARQAGGYAMQRAREAGGGLAQTMRDNPLAAALIGVGVGAAIGYLLPSTRAEDRWLGDASDEMKEQAREAGRHTADRAAEVAGHAAAAAASAAASDVGVGQPSDREREERERTARERGGERSGGGSTI